MTLVNVPKTIAFFETTLAASITKTATAFTLTSATDKDGTTLADDTYAFVIDEGNSNEEIVVCRCIGTAVTEALRGVSVLTGNTEVTALKFTHRRGASVKMTTAPIVPIITNIMRGDYELDFVPTLDGSIVTKAYADAIASAGAATANTTTKGLAKLSVVAVDTAEPIVVGDNDPRVPTSDESDAMAGGGDFGAPSTSNKFVTKDYSKNKPPEIVEFTATGTWTKDAGLNYIVIEGVGAGGGGGGTYNAGGGDGTGALTGGSGGYFKKIISADDLGATETVTIGAGGAGGATNSTGSTGVTTSFGSHCQSTGGTGGTTDDTAFGAGGTATGGDINITGNSGISGGTDQADNGNEEATPGGYTPSVLGSKGRGGSVSSTKGVAGAAGAAGYIIVTEYYS